MKKKSKIDKYTDQEALDYHNSGKPGKIEDYQVSLVTGVALKPSEDAVSVYTAREMNASRFKN